jgi:hypothetical protein
MGVLLISSFGCVTFVKATAHFTSDLAIQSPVNGTTFNTNNVTVTFSFSNPFASEGENEGMYRGTDVSCILDGRLYSQPQITLSHSVSVAYGEVNLINLSQGFHTVAINLTAGYLSGWGGPAILSSYASALFSVSTSQPTNQPTQEPTQSIQPATSQPVTPASKHIEAQYIYAEIFFAIVISVIIVIWIVYRRHSLKLKAKGEGTEKEK